MLANCCRVDCRRKRNRVIALAEAAAARNHSAHKHTWPVRSLQNGQVAVERVFLVPEIFEHERFSRCATLCYRTFVSLWTRDRLRVKNYISILCCSLFFARCQCSFRFLITIKKRKIQQTSNRISGNLFEQYFFFFSVDSAVSFLSCAIYLISIV